MPFATFFRGWTDPTDTEEAEEDAVVPLDMDLHEIDIEKTEEPAKAPAPEKPPEPEPEPQKAPEPAPTPTPQPDPTPDPELPTLPPPSGPGEEGTQLKSYKIISELSGREANNVRVVFVGTELRKHPVGLKLGSLLASHPQWEDFFAKNDLDPVKDVDGVMLTGPQFRVSNKVIAVLKVQDATKITKVVEHLVKVGDGKWLEPKQGAKPVKAAITKAEGYERVFAVVPSDNLLFMIPTPYPSDKREAALQKKDPDKLKVTLEQADAKLAKHLKGVASSDISDFSKSEWAIDAYMVEPSKLVGKKGSEGRIELPLLGEIELIPRTITRARLRVRVEPAGGATLFLAATSKTPEQAVKDAELLNSLLPAARAAASLEFKLELPEFKFEVKDRAILATVAVNDAFLEQVLTMGAAAVEKDRVAYANRKERSLAPKIDVDKLKVPSLPTVPATSDAPAPPAPTTSDAPAPAPAPTTPTPPTDAKN